MKTLVTLLLLTISALAQIPAQANAYRPQLTREARHAWGLNAPVTIFAAQVHQESGWKENAKSPVGALGIAQFMPGTATWLAKLYPAELNDAAPLDARWSLRALVTYDTYLWSHVYEFKDDGLNRWAATLSAYNGGLGWVNRDRVLTIKRDAQCDHTAWWDCVERYSSRSAAAFRENRQYPKRILFAIKPAYDAAHW